MELTYLQNCPSCGAPIELEEADRVVVCPFCDVRNYMVKRGPLRFILPGKIPDDIDAEDIFHVPYLRFKGHIYSCQGKKVDHKIVDTTHLGIQTERMPLSLGLRPQAMKIQMLGAQQDGNFVRLSEKISSIFVKAAKITDVFSDNKDQLFHRAYIGESVSFIYLPTYKKDDNVFDGVLNRPIADLENIYNQIQNTEKLKQEWLPQFISTICPHCAEVMEGAYDSLILACRNCESLWQEIDGRFRKVIWSILPSKTGESLFLPFWKISVKADGVELKTYADFIRLTNQPVVVRPNHDNIDASFWIPAFKIRPRYFLHIAKNLMVSQPHIPVGEKKLEKNLYPVTLPVSEAIQSMKSVIASTIMNKRHFMPLLPEISIQAKEAELVYLPFQYVGHDLVQEHTGVTVASTTLRFGRTM